MKTEPCVGCGYCCSTAPCALGHTFGATKSPCTFLIEDGGRKWCVLIQAAERTCIPEMVEKFKESIAIGGGCSSTLFNDVREQQLAKKGTP